MAKKLLDQARDQLRTMHYSYRTEETYLDWMRRYILFHQKRHPENMGAPEIQSFLVYLASERSVSASTHTCPGGRCQGNQALSAILFLYRDVLHKEIEPILLSTAKRPERLPTVLTRAETLAVIDRLAGAYKLMAQLLYGSGLRLTPALACRCKCGVPPPAGQGYRLRLQNSHRSGWQGRKGSHHASARLPCPCAYPPVGTRPTPA